MARRMLIDASHPEETRVVVVDGTRLEEFDFETASRKPLKGNIYLAKVIRIEPSLQAAFVEYGGNRHGFLAFSEIHPDYYQIPVADRERLIAEQQRLEAEDEDDHEPRRRRRVDRTDIDDARAARREEPVAENGVDETTPPPKRRRVADAERSAASNATDETPVARSRRRRSADRAAPVETASQAEPAARRAACSNRKPSRPPSPAKRLDGPELAADTPEPTEFPKRRGRSRSGSEPSVDAMGQPGRSRRSAAARGHRSRRWAATMPSRSARRASAAAATRSASTRSRK